MEREQPESKRRTVILGCLLIPVSMCILGALGLGLLVEVVAGGNVDPVVTMNTEHVRSLAFSPDSNRLASGSTDGVIRIWDTHSGQLRLTLSGHTREVNSLAWNSGGSRLASTGWNDMSLRIWDTTTGQATKIIQDVGAEAVAWSPDDTRLATSGGGSGIRIWNPVTGEVILSFPAGSGRESVDWHPDGTHIASTSGYENDAPVISDASSGQLLQTLGSGVNMRRLFAIAWSPDGNYLASGGNDEKVRIWDVATGKLILAYRKHTSTVYDLAWSPDGSKIASAGEAGDSTIRIWDPMSGKTLSVQRNTRGAIPIFLGNGFTTVDWSPDGKWLAAGDRDGTIRIWRVSDMLK
jgi:WD40 repeat protein